MVFNFKRQLSEELSKIGYIEILTYPYTEEGSLKLLNPVDETKPYLRQNLIKSMAKAIDNNAKYTDTLKLFEISNVFTSEQYLHLSIGCFYKENNNNSNANQTYTDLLRVIAQLGFDYTKFSTKLIESNNIIHYSEQPVGWVGESGVIEIDITVLVNILSTIMERYQSIPKYPAVKRDITVTVPNTSSAQDIYNTIQTLVSPRCYYIGFRDKFQNGDFTNYTFHLEFRDLDKSLSDEEVNTEIDLIQKHFI